MSLIWIIALTLGGIWLGRKLKTIFTADYRDDPIYKKNVQRLIERNRKIEDAKE
jgi:hypothetical protein